MFIFNMVKFDQEHPPEKYCKEGIVIARLNKQKMKSWDTFQLSTSIEDGNDTVRILKSGNKPYIC